MAGIRKKSGRDSYVLAPTRSPPPTTAGAQWEKQSTLSPGLLSQWFPLGGAAGSTSRSELKLLYHEVHGSGTGQTVSVEKDPVAWLKRAFTEQRVALYKTTGATAGSGGTAKAAATGPATAAAPAEEKPPEPVVAEKNHSIEIVLVDEDDQPVEGIDYEFTLPDGTKALGISDLLGRGYADSAQAGAVTVAFPKLDGEVWDPA